MQRLLKPVQPLGERAWQRGVCVVAQSERDAERVRYILEREALDPDLHVTHAAGAADAAGAAVDLVVSVDPTVAEVRALAGARPRRRVVAVVDDPPASAPRQLLEAGAGAVVSRATLLDALGPACRLVMTGHICVPAGSSDTVGLPALSLRERQVLALMARGLNNAEIAQRLYVSVSTVKSHAASAFRRLGVRSRREAVTLVLGTNEDLRRIVLASQPPEPAGLQRSESE